MISFMGTCTTLIARKLNVDGVCSSNVVCLLVQVVVQYEAMVIKGYVPTYIQCFELLARAPENSISLFKYSNQ